MIIGSEKDLEGLKKIGKVTALIRDELAKHTIAGITTGELDQIAAKLLSHYGAKSAPISQYNFPGHTCISINDIVAHGIPSSDTIIRSGDIVNIDVSAELDGYFADTGLTLLVGPGDPVKERLLQCSKQALQKAIRTAKAGVMLRKVGEAVEREALRNDFTVIKNLSGHGIGKKLHEEPHNVPNYYDRWNTVALKNGMVLAIETFIADGAEYVYLEQADNWSLKTIDGSLAAQFEHTIVITRNEPIVLTA